MDRFAELLYDLGKIWNVNLYAEHARFCRINYQQQLDLQLEYEEAKQRILIASFLCDIPPGKYKETLFKETLKANGIYPRPATFAYSDRNNKLVLFEYVYLENLTGEKLTAMLEKFIQKAHEWKLAIEKGGALPTVYGRTK